jgi:hypothetical protein
MARISALWTIPDCQSGQPRHVNTSLRHLYADPDSHSHFALPTMSNAKCAPPPAALRSVAVSLSTSPLKMTAETREPAALASWSSISLL